MNDLPQQPQTSSDMHSTPVTSVMGMGKEGEGMIAPVDLQMQGIGQEIQLPKEVESVGVKVTPQTVPLPPQILQAGVQAVGSNVPVPMQPQQAVHLPLNDEQIAKALNESITFSIRWLAEWCVRKIKIVHAKVIRKH